MLRRLPAGIKPRHHTIDRLHDRGVERGSARRFSLKPDEHWNRFKGDVGETSEKIWSAYGRFRVHTYHLQLNCPAFDVLREQIVQPKRYTHPVQSFGLTILPGGRDQLILRNLYMHLC